MMTKRTAVASVALLCLGMVAAFAAGPGVIAPFQAHSESLGMGYITATPLQTNLGVGYAYPVPFKPSAGHTTIKFDNLAPGSVVKIYTILGELVKELDGPVDSNDRITWNVLNQDGEPVASGVYIYQIKNSVSEKRGKLIIIR